MHLVCEQISLFYCRTKCCSTLCLLLTHIVCQLNSVVLGTTIGHRVIISISRKTAISNLIHFFLIQVFVKFVHKILFLHVYTANSLNSIIQSMHVYNKPPTINTLSYRLIPAKNNCRTNFIQSLSILIVTGTLI